MKKVLAIVSALLCASTMLSFAACGDSEDPATVDSDIVTEDVWYAAFNAADVTNVTVTYTRISSNTYSNELVSEGKDVWKDQMITLYDDDKIYSERNYSTEYADTYTDLGLEKGAENTYSSTSGSDKTYCLNNNGNYYSATLDTSEGADGEWDYYDGMGLILSCVRGYNYMYNFAGSFSSFEYSEDDGAYIRKCEWPWDSDNYPQVSMFSNCTYGYYTVYYVKINDGYISSVKEEEVVSIVAYGADNGNDYDYIYNSTSSTEYIYTNYGTTTVTIPDDIMEGLNAL